MSGDQRELRVNGYYTINGMLLPSVTTVLGCVTPPRLIEWYKRTSFAEQKSITDTAKDIGVRVHTMVEQYLKGEPCPDPDPVVIRCLQAFKQFEEQVGGIEPVAIEQTLWTDTYAGTCDLIATIGRDLAVLDIKTSKAIHETYELQLHAYAWAWYHMQTRNTPDPNYELLPKKLYCVRLDKENGSLEHRCYDWSVEKFHLFEKMIDIFHWMEEGKRANYIKRPVATSGSNV